MGTFIVTGGAGYIGSHTIIELLANTRHRVISVDNYSNSDVHTYDRIRKISGKDFSIRELDLCDRGRLFDALEKVEDIEGIIHFAAFKSVPDSVRDPLGYYRNNIESLNNLLQFCKEKKIGNFIFSSSCSVYGNADTLPVTENTPMKKAESPYGHTKQIGEDILSFFCQSEPWFNTVILRYFNPVGAHSSGLNGELPINPPTNLLPVITQTALGLNALTVFGDDYDTRDGSCIRDYIHVSDIAEAHVRAMEYLTGGRNKKNLSIFNLGTGKGVTVLEVIRSFEKVAGQKLNYTVGKRRAGDVIAVYADNSLAKKELGWEPHRTLDDMTESAWKWQLRLRDDKSI